MSRRDDFDGGRRDGAEGAARGASGGRVAVEFKAEGGEDSAGDSRGMRTMRFPGSGVVRILLLYRGEWLGHCRNSIGIERFDIWTATFHRARLYVIASDYHEKVAYKSHRRTDNEHIQSCRQSLKPQSNAVSDLCGSTLNLRRKSPTTLLSLRLPLRLSLSPLPARTHRCLGLLHNTLPL